MLFGTRNIVMAGSVLCIGIAVVTLSHAQSGENPYAEPIKKAEQALRREYTIKKSQGGFPIMVDIAKMPGATPEIRQAAEELRDAEGDEAKANAEKKLRDLLTHYFDDDMKQRQTALEEMEARLAKLEEQLGRRRAKQADIVDLQIKVLINEADGLGFFSGAQPSAPSGFIDVAVEGFQSPYQRSQTYIQSPVRTGPKSIEAPRTVVPSIRLAPARAVKPDAPVPGASSDYTPAPTPTSDAAPLTAPTAPAAAAPAEVPAEDQPVIEPVPAAE